MSLIEKALARLHENRGRNPDPPVVAVSTPATPVHEPGPALAPPPLPPNMIQPRGELHLPRSRLRDLGMLPPEDHERLISEQYRTPGLPDADWYAKLSSQMDQIIAS